MAYIEFDKVVKEYPSGGSVIRALDEASFTGRRRPSNRDPRPVRRR